MVFIVTLGLQYNVGEILIVMLNTYIINHHARPSDTTNTKHDIYRPVAPVAQR